MTELIITAAILASGILALKFDSMHLSRIFKKSPISNKTSHNGDLKMFYVSKRK